MNEELENEEEKTSEDIGSNPEENEEVINEVDETTNPPASEDETNEVDYEAELAIEKKRREGAEQKIVDMKKQSKDGVDVDIDTIVEEKVNAKMQDSATDLLADVLTGITNEKERNLVKYHYENSIKPTGFTTLAIQKDVARARLIANEGKIAKENSEMKIALKAKHSTGNACMGSNQDKTSFEQEPNYSPADKKLMERHGLTSKDIKE